MYGVIGYWGSIMLQSVELKDLGLSLAESLGHDFVSVVGYN